MAGKSLVHPSSLVLTVDAIDEATFFGKAIAPAQARAAAGWIAARIGGSRDRFVEGSYRGMPALTDKDYRSGGKLFTGERVGSHAGLGCKFGFEALRAMILLDKAGRARELSRKVTDWMDKTQKDYARLGHHIGMYCCTSCSGAMWRLAAVGGIAKHERLLADGLGTLRAWRDGKGKWGRFPFFYTLLALSEIDLPAARAELKYAAGVCEKVAGRPAADGYAKRRKALAERVLAMC
ncbi:MAG: hypothetical protein ACE15C_13905 [Phycisphaerae bacterium]